MPRIRTIKPEFQLSESMGNISRDARLIFILMWPQADDAGRLRADERMLASLLLPYDADSAAVISAALQELEQEKCIMRYCNSAGHKYLQIVNWAQHQKIDKPNKNVAESPDAEQFANFLESSPKSRERSRRDRDRDRDQDRDQDRDKETANTRFAGLFEEFWKLVPCKRNRADAERAFRSAVQTHSVEHISRMTRLYYENGSQPPDVKLPAAFLRNCLKDDPGAWKSNGSFGRGKVYTPNVFGESNDGT